MNDTVGPVNIDFISHGAPFFYDDRRYPFDIFLDMVSIPHLCPIRELFSALAQLLFLLLILPNKFGLPLIIYVGRYIFLSGYI